MDGQSQSWRHLTLQAKMFIGLIVTIGTCVLLFGAIHQSSKNIAEFICYLGIAVLASRMKVNLPGITGTMSVNFLFVLLGVLELSFSETLILGCVSILVQSLYPDRPNAIQVTFNVCAGALSTALAYFVYHHPFFNLLVDSRPLLLGVAACTYFVANTGSIATVISLTEGKRLSKIIVECYFWSFPYYLVGAGIAGVIGWFNQTFYWETSLLLVPAIYVIYRSYRLYLGKLEDEKRHVEEMASLHLRTIEALALAIEAKDQTTHDHLQRVRVYAVEVAKELGVSPDEMQAVHAAALLHDIGKLAVPEHIISQARPPHSRRIREDEDSPGGGSRDLAAGSLPLPSRAHRTGSSREVGRFRIPSRPEGYGNPNRRADSVGCRLPRRFSFGPAVSARPAHERGHATPGRRSRQSV